MQNPNVALNFGEFKKVSFDVEKCFLVSTNNKNKFIQQCERLLIDKDFQHQLAVTAKTIVRERFDLDQNTNQFIALYQSIVQ